MVMDYTTLGNTTGTAAANDIAAKNAASPTAIDGTPLLAALLDNGILGWQQALLDFVGVTADSITESKSASQILESFKSGFGYPGEVVGLFTDSDPAPLGLRLLLLDGTGILLANYTELTTATYVGDGNNAAVGAAGGGFYKASDAAGTTPDTAGPYLILPDSRGRVLRGLDSAGTVDPDGASRYLGDVQVDALQKHNHLFASWQNPEITVWFPGSDVQSGTGSSPNFTSITSSSRQGASETEIGEAMTNHDAATVTPTGRVDTETRSNNISINWAIRY